MNEFFSMGGYAFYVWSSYGVSLLVLVWVYVYPVMQRRKLIQHLKHHQKRQTRLARRQR
jgi:heme exporter protein D